MRKISETLLASPPPRAHIVQMYHDDKFLVETVGLFASEGLMQGDAVILIATAAHRRLFEAALAKRGIAPKKGRLLALDAAECLARFRDGAGFNQPAFLELMGGIIKNASGAEGRPVRIYGEIVNLLWKAGEAKAALALELMWNDLAKRVQFSLFCAYHVAPESSNDLRGACEAHTHLIPDNARRLAPWLAQNVWLADSPGAQVLARLSAPRGETVALTS